MFFCRPIRLWWLLERSIWCVGSTFPQARGRHRADRFEDASREEHAVKMVWCKVDDVLTMLAEIGFCEGIYQEKCEKEMRILEVFFCM